MTYLKRYEHAFGLYSALRFLRSAMANVRSAVGNVHSAVRNIKQKPLYDIITTPVKIHLQSLSSIYLSNSLHTIIKVPMVLTFLRARTHAHTLYFFIFSITSITNPLNKFSLRQLSSDRRRDRSDRRTCFSSKFHHLCRFIP